MQCFLLSIPPDPEGGGLGEKCLPCPVHRVLPTVGAERVSSLNGSELFKGGCRLTAFIILVYTAAPAFFCTEYVEELNEWLCEAGPEPRHPTQCGPEMLTEGQGVHLTFTGSTWLVTQAHITHPICRTSRVVCVCMYIQQMAHRCGSLKFISWKPTLKAIALGGGAYCDAKSWEGATVKPRISALSKETSRGSPALLCEDTAKTPSLNQKVDPPRHQPCHPALVTATLQDLTMSWLLAACNAI